MNSLESLARRMSALEMRVAALEAALDIEFTRTQPGAVDGSIIAHPLRLETFDKIAHQRVAHQRKTRP